jgi:hypothetical protein
MTQEKSPGSNASQGCQMVRMFSYQKSQFWYITGDLEMGNIGVFGHLEYITAFW